MRDERTRQVIKVAHLRTKVLENGQNQNSNQSLWDYDGFALSLKSTTLFYLQKFIIVSINFTLKLGISSLR